MKKFSIIVAADEDYGIGKKGQLPWHLPEELAYFQRITTGNGNNAVIMGRTTWETIPIKFRPLQKRLNIVLTRQPNYDVPQEALRAASLDDALNIAQKAGLEEIFIIGGGKVFEEAIHRNECSKIFLTEIQGSFGCDTFFPKIEGKKFRHTSESTLHAEKNTSYRFVVFEKK